MYSVGGWMDGWNLFRPEARSLEGLCTLTTYNSLTFGHQLVQALYSFPFSHATCCLLT
jgi:hypothetical protein